MRRGFAAFLLAGCGGPDPSRVPELSADDPVSRAIERVAAYLHPRSLEHDELWFVQHGSVRLGGDFPAWASARAEAGSPDGAERALAATRTLRLPEIEPLAGAPATERRVAPAYMSGFAVSHRIFAQLLTLAADCDPAEPASVAALHGALVPRTEGYVLAHQAWAVRIGAARGCVAPRVADAFRRAMASALLAELRGSDAVTDLDIERAAVLCLIEACAWVPEPWLDAMLRAQHADGGWGDRADPSIDPGVLREEHTAALAFYLLAARLTPSDG